MMIGLARKFMCAGAGARSVPVRGIELALVGAMLLAACGERPPSAAQPSEAAKLVGVAPAPPSPEPPTVKPVASDANELAKPVEIAAMPLPGQADDIETIAALNSQRSEAIAVLKDPELAKIANSDAALEVWRKRALRQAQVNQLQRSRQPAQKAPAAS
ncbi:MAG: hypothetical protein ACXWBU_15680 [Usitatibacter sp.]